jgi:hypothetical protein
MRDTPTQNEPGAPCREHGTIPPIEDLFSFTMDQTDFMSAQSFPASDPPSHSSPAEPYQDCGDCTRPG